ncbi:MAG TPA: hypothetical protein VKP30_26555, partial [Polyangiaceae bacterium]|nr:hypothetical protein [Polyangiaceae bacterium]
MEVRSHSGWTKRGRGLVIFGLLQLSTWCAAAANSETGSKPERPTSAAARDSGSGSYSVSKHCPSRAQFVKEVLARSPVAARSS